MENEKWVKRDQTNLWTTSLAKLLSGDLMCEYLPWFKAKHKLAVEEPSDFKLTKHNILHTAMLREEKAKLEAEGWTTLVEVPLKLVYPGDILVSGKVDLIGIKDDSNRGIIIDCKSGKPKLADQTQIMIYALLLGYSDERFKDIQFDCRVMYTGSEVCFTREEITDEIADIFYELVLKIGSDEPCLATGSKWDCRYCDVNCNQKIK